MSQNKLAICARMTQSKLNRIANGQTQNPTIKDLLCISLSLCLNEKETIHLFASKERTFSPAGGLDIVYLDLVRIYAAKEINYNVAPVELSTILEEADEYLEKWNITLPNDNL